MAIRNAAGAVLPATVSLRCRAPYGDPPPALDPAGARHAEGVPQCQLDQGCGRQRVRRHELDVRDPARGSRVVGPPTVTQPRRSPLGLAIRGRRAGGVRRVRPRLRRRAERRAGRCRRPRPAPADRPTSAPGSHGDRAGPACPGADRRPRRPSAVSDAVMAALGSYTTGCGDPDRRRDRYATAAQHQRSHIRPGCRRSPTSRAGSRSPTRWPAVRPQRTPTAPILLTKPGSLPPATATELARLAPGRIVVLGGPTMISDALLAKLDTLTAGSATRRSPAPIATGPRSRPSARPPTRRTCHHPLRRDRRRASPTDSRPARWPASRAGRCCSLGRDTVPSVVSAEIRRLDPSTIVVVGGSGSVSEAVRSQIEGL